MHGAASHVRAVGLRAKPTSNTTRHMSGVNARCFEAKVPPSVLGSHRLHTTLSGSFKQYHSRQPSSLTCPNLRNQQPNNTHNTLAADVAVAIELRVSKFPAFSW